MFHFVDTIYRSYYRDVVVATTALSMADPVIAQTLAFQSAQLYNVASEKRHGRNS